MDIHDLAQDLIVALLRLRAASEERRPEGVLQRLVHERKVRELCRYTLGLQIQCSAYGVIPHPEARIVEELGGVLEELTRRRPHRASSL